MTNRNRYGTERQKPRQKDPISGNVSHMEYKGIPVDPLTHLAMVRMTQNVGFVIPERYIKGIPGREDD